MKWVLNWIISIVTIYISAYFLNFYSSLSELVKTIDVGAFFFVLFAGAFSSSCSIFILFILEKILAKFNLQITRTIFLLISMLITIPTLISSLSPRKAAGLGQGIRPGSGVRSSMSVYCTRVR